MKYLDQVCGLRLKTAVKVIAIIGMVASLVGFSIAVNRMIQTSARHSNSTDAQTLASEEYLVGNQEEGTGGATGFHEEDTTVLPFVDEGSNMEIENVGLTEGLEEESGSGDVVSRSKRDVTNTANTEKLVSGNTDSSVQVPPTSSGNVVPDYIDNDNEAIQSSVTKRPSPVVTSTPKPELASSNTPPTTSSTTKSTTMKKTDAEEMTSTTEKPVENVPDLPESKEKGNNPASSEDESYQDDQQDQDPEILEEISEETEFEIPIEVDIDTQDYSANEDNLTDEDVGETKDDEVDSGSSRASQVVTGLGAPICLLGFLANAVLLHSAKKAEKKLLIFWLVWSAVLYMYQIFAMIVNLCDLSPYIFSNLMLFMLSAGAGYVVLSYRKQLTDPSSYSLKTVEMNGYALDKGYMELDNKGTSGTSAGGDNNV